MNKEKKELINTIKDNIKEVYSNRKTVKEIKHRLLKNHGITGGRVESVLNDPGVLVDADVREIALFLEQFFAKTGNLELNPKRWFTQFEMVEAKQYDMVLFERKSDYATFELENVLVAGNGVYVTTISPKVIAELMDNQVLYYNHEIQRQPTFIKRQNEMIRTPTVYPENIKEIKELLLKQKLVSTTIALNAAIGSSEIGEEYTFNSAKGTLTINKGTRLDILDGYHRCLASGEAYHENKELGEFEFILRLSNYTTREAAQYQAQLAKATPIPKARQQELAAERLADVVIQQLKAESEIGEHISSHHRVSPSAGELVSYNVFADAVEREFPMNVRIEARSVSKWLSEFFEYLIGMNQEEFAYNSKTQKSLMNYNKMFAGYIALAAKMRQENIGAEELQSILSDIDFSRNNTLWIELGVLDKNKKITSNANEKNISKHFSNLNLEKYKLETRKEMKL